MIHIPQNRLLILSFYHIVFVALSGLLLCSCSQLVTGPPPSQANLERDRDFVHSQALSIKGPKPAWDVILDDLDADGAMDIAILSKYRKVLFVFGIDEKKPERVEKKTLCNRPVSMALGDFDMDGHKDIAVMSEAGLKAILTVQSNHEVNENQIDYPGSGRMWSIAAIDLDGDLKEDLVGGGAGLVFYYNHGGLKFYTIQQPMNFSLFKSKRMDSNAIFSLEKADDLNGDGRFEIVFSDYFAQSVLVAWSSETKKYKLTRPLFFTKSCPIFATPVLQTQMPWWVVVTDTPPGSLIVYEGKQNWAKTEQRNFPGRISRALVGDLNEDGCPDVAVFVEAEYAATKPGKLHLVYGICDEEAGYRLGNQRVLDTGVFSTKAMAYNDPYLAIADYQSGRVEIFKKGRNF